MASILASRCCNEGVRYQGGAFPVKCPRCGQKCDWAWATIENEPALDLTAWDAIFLKINKINPERPLDPVHEES